MPQQCPQSILDPEHNELDAHSVVLSSAISLSSQGASHTAQDSKTSPHKNFLLKFIPKGSRKAEIGNEGGQGISSDVREIAVEMRDGKGQGPFSCSVLSGKQTEASVNQRRTSPASQRGWILSPQTSQATFWWMGNDRRDENMYGRYYHGSRWIDGDGSGNGGGGSEGGSAGSKRDWRGKIDGKSRKRREGEEALERLERVIQAGAVEREVGGGVVSGEIRRRDTLRREKKRKEKAIMKEVLNERRLTEERLRDVFKQERFRVPDVPPSWKGKEKVKTPPTPTRGPRGHGHGNAHGRGRRGVETAVRVVPSLVTVQKGGRLTRDLPMSRTATGPERPEKQKSEPAAISHPRVSIGSVRSRKSQGPQMLRIDTTLDSPTQELPRARQRPLGIRNMMMTRLPVGLGSHPGDAPKVMVPQTGTPSKENRRTSSLFATSFTALNLRRHLSIRNSKPPSSHLNSAHPRPVTIVVEGHKVADSVRSHLYFDNNVPPPMMQKERGPKEGLATPLMRPAKSVRKNSVQSTPGKHIGRSVELGTSLHMMWDTAIVAPARTLSTRRPGNATAHLNNQPSEQVTDPSSVKKRRFSGVDWSLRNRHRQQSQTRTRSAPDVSWHAASSTGRGVGGRSPSLVKRDGVGLPEVVQMGKMEMKVQDREGRFYVVSERMGLKGRDVVFVMERPRGSVSEGDLLAREKLSPEKGEGRKSMGGSWRGQNGGKGRGIVVEEGERKRVMSVGGVMRGDENETLGRSRSARVAARLKRWMGRRMEDVPEEGNGTGPP